MSSIFQQVLQVQSIFTNHLLNIPNVVGVAVGYKESGGTRTDELALVTLVEQKKPLAALTSEQVIPSQLEGVTTDVVEIGFIRAQQSPTERFRPVIPSGVSIGHYKVTAGTLGTVVTDRSSGEKLLLSNNHVFANSNEALVGDAILQPGAIDGGQNPGDMVARLLRFVPLQYLEDPPSTDPPPTDPGQPGGCDVLNVIVGVLNYFAKASGSSKRVEATTAPSTATTPQVSTATNAVDAAVARPIDPNMFTGEVRNIGVVSGTKPPTLGMRVRKSGRTTDYTEGTINLINATVNVGYSTSAGSRTGRFTGQVITTAMSQGGDSGSLIVDQMENKAVGLLFAGSSVSTIFTPITAVLDALNINI